MVSAHHLPTLTTLIDGCKRGDSNAWIDFDRQVRPPVERALAKRLGHWVNTADLVSEVIEAMWQNDMKRLRAIDPRRGRVINFLTTVGVQLWRQGLRSHNRRPTVPLGPDPVDQRLHPLSVMFAVDQFSATLSHKSRTFFVCQVLNVPQGRPGEVPQPNAECCAFGTYTPGNCEAGLPSKTSQRRTERLAVLWQAFERGE
jgi:DNA-directed RNA polymerase specialized sigma24 family protein